MLITTENFFTKLTKEIGVPRETLLDFFHRSTEDEEFLSRIESGYPIYVIINLRVKDSFSIVHIKDNEETSMKYLEQEDILAVDGLTLLREKLAS